MARDCPNDASHPTCGGARIDNANAIPYYPFPIAQSSFGGVDLPEALERHAHVAKQTTITLIDDLDGSEADEQIEFSFEGRSYEIDLSEANSSRLRDALAPFVSAARKTGGRRSTATNSTSAARAGADREQNQAIRAWAQGQGLKISERGRIPATILEAFHQAH